MFPSVRLPSVSGVTKLATLIAPARAGEEGGEREARQVEHTRNVPSLPGMDIGEHLWLEVKYSRPPLLCQAWLTAS